MKIMVDEVNYQDLEGANNLATYEIRWNIHNFPRPHFGWRGWRLGQQGENIKNSLSHFPSTHFGKELNRDSNHFVRVFYYTIDQCMVRRKTSTSWKKKATTKKKQWSHISFKSNQIWFCMYTNIGFNFLSITGAMWIKVAHCSESRFRLQYRSYWWMKFDTSS